MHLNKGKKTNFLQDCTTSITKIKHYLQNCAQFLKYICKKDILVYQTLYIQMVAEQMNILIKVIVVNGHIRDKWMYSNCSTKVYNLIVATTNKSIQIGTKKYTKSNSGNNYILNLRKWSMYSSTPAAMIYLVSKIFSLIIILSVWDEIKFNSSVANIVEMTKGCTIKQHKQGS